MTELFNASVDLLEPHTANPDKVAYIDAAGEHSYAELIDAVERTAEALRALGLSQEQRIFICMLDSFELPVIFLGAIRAGIVPVLANTMLTDDDYRYMLSDSRARFALVSDTFSTRFEALAAELPELTRVITTDGPANDWRAQLDAVHAPGPVAKTHADEACFWLYSSGSTGRPKGTVHVHSSMRATVENYAKPILDIGPDDVVFSAAKLFFAYGLGNALSFPLAVGATTVLCAERPTPELVIDHLNRYQPSIFYGVPTLYAALLNSVELSKLDNPRLRCCTSAGEALPADIARQWKARLGVEILDGIGSTEMLHIFLSNRADDVRYGTTGRAVPGYELRIVDESDRPVSPGELGELQVKGNSAAAAYWNKREQSRRTFVGEWTRTGDKYIEDNNGYFVYQGRSDDMLKVGGIYVSPSEVEASLIEHQAVIEAAVVGREDDAGLTKPQAFVVTNVEQANEALKTELQAFVKSRLAPYKYPRWIEFVDELPKTATGKIQRFRLRKPQQHA